MAVSIDTVYQKVLAFANKEQRGYITPQDFNLFARQAQQEIFEQYFYDLNQVARIPGNEYVHSDVDDMLEEKMQVFERMDGSVTVGAYPHNADQSRTLPDYIYRISRVEFNGYGCDILKTKDFEELVAKAGPLIRPTNKVPLANIRNNQIRVIGGADLGGVQTFMTPTKIFYFVKIQKVPQWAYVVVNGKTLYNDNVSVDFQLHPSEESELVYRILAYAGITIQKPEITQVAAQLLGSQIQQEKQ